MTENQAISLKKGDLLRCINNKRSFHTENLSLNKIYKFECFAPGLKQRLMSDYAFIDIGPITKYFQCPDDFEYIPKTKLSKLLYD
jgi:hypothetical protein